MILQVGIRFGEYAPGLWEDASSFVRKCAHDKSHTQTIISQISNVSKPAIDIKQVRPLIYFSVFQPAPSKCATNLFPLIYVAQIRNTVKPAFVVWKWTLAQVWLYIASLNLFHVNRSSLDVICKIFLVCCKLKKVKNHWSTYFINTYVIVWYRRALIFFGIRLLIDPLFVVAFLAWIVNVNWFQSNTVLAFFSCNFVAWEIEKHNVFRFRIKSNHFLLQFMSGENEMIG